MEECGEQKFRCLDGKCISGDKRCDIHIDCLDNSDELKCGLCGPYYFPTLWKMTTILQLYTLADAV